MKVLIIQFIFIFPLTDDVSCRSFSNPIQAIDSGVKQIVKVLKQSGLYDNSIIIFSSDNGGAFDVSNYPLKGKKEQVYEGGVKAVGFVHSKLIRKPGKGKPGKNK